MISKKTMLLIYNVTKAYEKALEKLGFEQKRNIPITVKRLYEEYKALYDRDITLEQFFNMLVRLARIYDGISVSYHPLYYNELEKYYVIIHR
ncbi:MAG: hypothetical protein GXO43_06895 [Crenarchaeota archaeon]|nr:hypothetical protein [Thermoproteota archaeon]